MLSGSTVATGNRHDRPGWSLATRVLPILAFTAFTAISGQWKVELSFSPVPVTAQTLAVLLAGVCLGSRGGALAQLGYIGAGLIGLPVFVGGTNAWRIAAGGVPVIVGPTLGYLVGYVAAAFLVGWLVERGWGRQPMSLFDVLVLGNLVTYAFGVLWLLRFVPGGLSAAIVAGMLPFLAGDLLKLVLLTVSVTAVRWIVAIVQHRLIPDPELVPPSDVGSTST
jgi:biotin transport system substrate-specific component